MFNFKKKNILFVGAHCDDIEINAGGLISSISNSSNIFAYLATGGDSFRKYEAINGLKTIGVREENIFISNGKDKYLYKNLNKIISEIEAMLDSNNIDTLFTHYPYDTHQDHVSVSQASIAAGRLVNNLIYYRPTYPSGRPDIPFKPNMVSRLTAKNISKKVKAINCHKSQIKKYGEQKYLEVVKNISKSDAWVYGGFIGDAELFQISRSIVQF